MWPPIEAAGYYRTKSVGNDLPSAVCVALSARQGAQRPRPDRGLFRSHRVAIASRSIRRPIVVNSQHSLYVTLASVPSPNVALQ